MDRKALPIVERLLACPFCGENDDLLAIAADGLPFRCERCGATGPKAFTGQGNWNTRAPNPIIKECVEALERARNKFLHYEQLHRLKCTSEGDEKADRNHDEADAIDATLAKVRP